MDILGLSLLPPPKIQPSERAGASIGPRLSSAAHSPLSPLLFSRRYCNGKGFIHRVEWRGKGRNRIPIPNSTFAFVMQLPTAKPDTNRHRLAFFAADEAPMGGREEKGLGVRLIYPSSPFYGGERRAASGIRASRFPYFLPYAPSIRRFSRSVFARSAEQPQWERKKGAEARSMSPPPWRMMTMGERFGRKGDPFRSCQSDE